MKRRLILLSSITLLSFFLAISVNAQEKTTDAKKATKAKTEIVKKKVPEKCATCPNAAKCLGTEAVGANKAVKAGDAKEGAACCDEKAVAPVKREKKKSAAENKK